MLKLEKIAVTGSLGAGKTSVCQLMSEEGAFIIDADEIVHHLLASDLNCIQEITNLLGQKVRSNNHIDRKVVAKIVFSDPQKLYELEQIIHPKVINAIDRAYANAESSKAYKVFVVECPLLYEIGWEKYFDTTIMVTAPRSECLSRFKQKGFDPEEYDLRQDRQMATKEKAELSDFVIYNDATTKKLKKQVSTILETFQ